MVSPPWHSTVPPKVSQTKLISQLALPWLAVLCLFSYTTSVMHRSLHLLFASPVTLKGTSVHAGSPCRGNCLDSGFDRESKINHRISFRQINHRTWRQFEELWKRESCAGTRSHTECFWSFLYPQYFSEKVKITLNCCCIWKILLRSSALVIEKWVCAGNGDKNRLSLPVSVPHCATVWSEFNHYGGYRLTLQLRMLKLHLLCGKL